jgi:hypothetical protein
MLFLNMVCLTVARAQRFSAIINIGAKNKERKERELAVTARQVSDEEQVYKARLHDLLWLELLAWRYGLSMKAMDATLIMCRENLVPEVLGEVLDFEYCPTVDLVSGLSHEKKWMDDLGASVDSNSSCQNYSSCKSSFQNFSLPRNTSSCQEESLLINSHRWMP